MLFSIFDPVAQKDGYTQYLRLKYGHKMHPIISQHVSSSRPWPLLAAVQVGVGQSMAGHIDIR